MDKHLIEKFLTKKTTDSLYEPIIRESQVLEIKQQGDDLQCKILNLSDKSLPYDRYWANDIPLHQSFGWTTICPFTDLSCLLIRYYWGTKIIFEHEETKKKFEFLVNRFVQQQEVHQYKAEYYEGSIKEEKLDIEHPDYPLLPHQRAAVKIITQLKEQALFMEAGTGKTYCAIAKIMWDIKHGGYNRPLRIGVLCPNNVKHNWLREFQKFSIFKGRGIVVEGTYQKRLRKILDIFTNIPNEKFSVAVMSYDIVKTTIEVCTLPWDLLIADESHYIKSIKTKRTKSMMALSLAAKQKLILTGTPIANTIDDLYSQFEFLGQGLSGFNSLTAFQNFYESQKTKKINDRVIYCKEKKDFDKKPFLKERFSRLSFQVALKDVIRDIPEKTYEIRDIEMGKEQKQTYNNLENELAAEIKAGLEAKTITADNALVMLMRLSQITTGYGVIQSEEVKPERELFFFDPNPKLDELQKDIETLGEDEKMIVWCTHIPILEKAYERFKDISVVYHGRVPMKDRMALIDRFNGSKECRVFMANPAACSTGVNLKGYEHESQSTNTTKVVRLASDWSRIQREQSEARCYRHGTRLPVHYIDYIVPSTIDEEILDRLDRKKEISDGITKVNDILQSLLKKKEVVDVC